MARPQHSLSFFGAAGTVTGSRFLLESDGTRALLDCGLFQGYKYLRDRNRLPFPVAPSSLDALLLTHAHIDHSGYVPALIRDGYQGPVLATNGTIELLNLLLPDSAYLMEEEAAYARKKGYSKHQNPTPLYTSEDATVALARLRQVERGRSYEIAQGMRATWHPAGHIIGASSISVETAAGSVFFSGDLGHDGDALMLPPAPYPGSDVLVVESTYGNRSHGESNPEEQLVAALGPTLEAGGVVLIPAFAVGRTQTLMLHLSRLMDQGRLPNVPVFVNSPMAVNATDIYARHPDEQRISRQEISDINSRARFVKTVDQSIALNQGRGPMVIISAAGMLTGGRVLHHLVAFGQDPKNAIVLSGFQAGGTRGADLRGGKRTLRIFGMDIEIMASVTQIDSMSAHADAEGLLAWMRNAPKPPRMTYLVHGEEEAADRLRFRIEHELGWKARAPQHGDEVDLSAPR